MKILTVANQKGGVGKTAFLVNYAFTLAKEKKMVAVIDFDTQGNASYTLDSFSTEIDLVPMILGTERKVLDNLISKTLTLFPANPSLLQLDTVPLATVASGLSEVCKKIQKLGFDYLLIDTPPSLGNRLTSALAVSNFVISPIELEAYSLQGIALTVKTIYHIRQSNPNLKFLGMLPSRVDNRSPRQRENLIELQTAYPPSMVIPYKLSLRTSFADALATKRPIWEVKTKASRLAVKEFSEVANYVTSEMEAMNL